MQHSTDNIKERILGIRSSLPEGVRLVAVSKFHSAEMVMKAYVAGERIFGESRVQDLVEKRSLLPEDIEWHFIGTLQSNKVKYIAPFISMIQSADSVKLLKEIDVQAEKNGRIIEVLLEVHIAREESKHGFSPEACESLFSGGVSKLFPNIKICGLMGMATFTVNARQVEREFESLRQLFETVRALPQTDGTIFKELSMGMSDDYKLAIKHGSTMIRTGTAIFGER
jgi:pyridoxal phosphate enzyme (YggS family)